MIEPNQTNLLKRMRSSLLLWMVVLFAVGNLGIAALFRNCALSPNRSWISYRFKQFDALRDTPDIGILGSSLMVQEVAQSDGFDQGGPLSRTDHNRWTHFEHALSQRIGVPISTFTFAVDGMMASDACLVCQNLVTSQRTPKCIVYGIAPRDFINNALLYPSTTETFKYLRHRLPGASFALYRDSPPEEQRDFCLGRILPIIANRQQILGEYSRCAAAFSGNVFATNDADEVRTPPSIREMFYTQSPDDHGVNESWITATTASFTGSPHDLDLYKISYVPFDKKKYELQLSYFDRMLRAFHSRGTSVIVVNMPITQVNSSLLPAGVYPQYTSDVKRLCASNEAKFINMNDASMFSPNMFRDSVHLNALGAIKLADQLSKQFVMPQSLAHTSSPTM